MKSWQIISHTGKKSSPVACGTDLKVQHPPLRILNPLQLCLSRWIALDEVFGCLKCLQAHDIALTSAERSATARSNVVPPRTLVVTFVQR